MKRGSAAWSPSVALRSAMRAARLFSETNVPGHRRSKISCFDNAFGRFSISTRNSSNAFGVRWISCGPESSRRSSKSMTNSSKASRMARVTYHGTRMGQSLFDLSGKTAVVAGGTSGIGRTLALGLAEAGADVVVVGRREDFVQEAASAIEAKGRRT